MPAVFSLVKDVNAKRIDWALKLRLVRAYEIPVYGNRNQIQSFECVFRDAEGATIRGSARPPHMESARFKLQEGNLYIIAYFIVSKDELKYKTATHEYKFSFYAKTKIKPIHEESFPNNRFIFKSFDQIARLKVEDESLLFDVIGRLVGMSEPKVMPTKDGDKQLMEIEVEDLSERKLTITLWEEYVAKVMPYYNSGTTDPIVIVMQFCRPKIFQANVKVSNTYNCSQMFVNDDIWEINEFRKEIERSKKVERVVASVAAASGSGGSPSNEFATGRAVVKNLQELCEGVDGQFWVYCTIADIENPQNLWYMACQTCHRKLTKDGDSYQCKQHGESQHSENYRYKIEVRVIDETYNAIFLVWDIEGGVLFGKSAFKLKQMNEEESGVVDFLVAKLVDTNVLFKVSKKTDAHHTSRSTYSVIRICDDAEVLGRFRRSYVESQESDLISKLGRRTNGVESTDSSEDEVSTPDKKLKGLISLTDEDDTVETKFDKKAKCNVGLIDDDSKVKRRLDDQFSTSVGKRQQKDVVVKIEKS